MAYAAPWSSPYSWLRGGDFLNYVQWQRGVTWPVADKYSAIRHTHASGENVDRGDITLGKGERRARGET